MMMEKETYSEAENSSCSFAVMALMALLCACNSPIAAQLSTFQILRIPPRQALARQFDPGMNASPHIQSL
jgi:hypothetical protein